MTGKKRLGDRLRAAAGESDTDWEDGKERGFEQLETRLTQMAQRGKGFAIIGFDSRKQAEAVKDQLAYEGMEVRLEMEWGTAPVVFVKWGTAAGHPALMTGSRSFHISPRWTFTQTED